jgi:hypothetical protein
MCRIVSNCNNLIAVFFGGSTIDGENRDISGIFGFFKRINPNNLFFLFKINKYHIDKEEYCTTGSENKALIHKCQMGSDRIPTGDQVIAC